MERNDLGNPWREAFKGAEVQPSDASWLAIESELLFTENQSMKRRVVVYQRLAAASLIFAILFGAYDFYSWKHMPSTKASLATVRSAEDATAQSQTGEPGRDQGTTRDNSKQALAVLIPNPAHTMQKNTGKDDRNPSAALNLILTGSSQMSERNGDYIDSTRSRDAVESADSSGYTGPAIAALVPEVPPVGIQQKDEEPVQLPGEIEDVEESRKQQKKTSMDRENVWASVSLSAGNYNSGAGSGLGYAAPSPVTRAAYSTGNNQPSAGSSYSVGFTLGKRVADRWVILSGIHYLNQSLGYTANSSYQGQAYLANSNTMASPPVTFTGPYAINSVNEYVSIPVQAGYLLVDQKLGLQMNAGVATDLFLRNTLLDPSGQVSPVTQGGGDDSPYRSINWAGLASTELSYKVASQYRLSVMPGIRYLFNPVFKSGSDHPYSAEIGFRFRYILK
jgi:hypothetical protein